MNSKSTSQDTYSSLLSNRFSQGISGKDKVSEIVYSFIAGGCKYRAIILEQSYEWVPVWSIIGRSFKLLIFVCLVSVNLWVFIEMGSHRKIFLNYFSFIGILLIIMQMLVYIALKF